MNISELEAVFPTSVAQQEVIAGHAVSAHKPDCVQLSCEIRGDLDPADFARAWEKILVRHILLRSSFVWKRVEVPRQLVFRTVPSLIDFRDLRDLPEEDRVARICEEETAQRCTAFDLACPPLIRLVLFRENTRLYHLLLTAHAVLCDLRSLSVIVTEIVALSDGGSLPELPAMEQEYDTHFKDLRWTEAESYWQSALSNASRAEKNVPDWDGMWNKPREPEFFKESSIKLPRPLVRKLQRSPIGFNGRLSALLTFAWALLFSRYTQSNDVIVGMASTGTFSGSETSRFMAGSLDATLPMRLCFSPETTLLECLASWREQLASVLEYSFCSERQIAKWVRFESEYPMFASRVSLYSLENKEQIGHVDVSNWRFYGDREYPLSLSITDGSRCHIRAVFLPTAFPARRVDKILRDLRELLEDLVAHSEKGLSRVSSLTENKNKESSSEGERPFVGKVRQHISVVEMIERRASETPEAVAAICGGDRLTYGQLNVHANHLAHDLVHRLQERGLGLETRIAVYLGRSFALLEAILGILKAGVTYVPLDPLHPQERLAWLLSHSQSVILLTEHRMQCPFSEGVDIVFLDESQLSMREESRANPVIEASGDNVAYLLYTSGSTGHPKGVLVPRSSLTEYAVAFADAIQIRPSDRILQFASIGFDVSLEEIVPAWISGATIVLPRSENVALTEDLLHVLATQEVTIVELPTAFWTAWIENLESRGRSLPDSLRLVIVGGERVLTRSAVTWTREFGVPLANVYGLTEATITSTLYHVPCDLTELMGFDTLPIGWPLSNTTVYLLDQHLNSVRADEVGEVYVGGTGVGRCFLNEPRVTAEAFIPDPYTVQAGARMYKTGDLARHGVDGAIHFIGRVDTQVKVRGYRVELSEVEKVLALHPAVGDCMVRLDSDGKTDTTLVAYWTPRKSCKDTVRCEELGAWLLGKLPEYMVPTRFVVLDSLPLTDRGKVDRRKTFSSACDIGGRDSGLPVNRVEDLVITVFSEVLNVGGIDALDSFFELGGHSLSAIKIVSRLQERLGIELPVRMIFEAPKIRNLAAQITERLDRVPQDASDLPATSHTDVAAQTTANTRENSV